MTIAGAKSTKRSHSSPLPLDIRDCGLMDYREALELQHSLRWRRAEGHIANTVLIVEHPPVITLGARQSANKLLASPQQLANMNIDVVDIRRGGGSTAHNPGQLVFYPICDLRQLGLGISRYIRQLEAIGADLLRELGIETVARDGLPGLWIEHRKIASIGVRVSRGITHHGMAINLNNDLSIFDLIVPCGLMQVQMTSFHAETGRRAQMETARSILSRLVSDRFAGGSG